MNPINLYSTLLLILVILILMGWLLLRRGANPQRILVWVLFALGVVGAWWLVRPVQTPHADEASLRLQIGAGMPVLLEFQSPY